MHAIWSHLLNEEFMNAYVHGMLVECVDRTVYWFFPWIFTYSADYSEKYILSHTFLCYLSQWQDASCLCQEPWGLSMPMMPHNQSGDPSAWHRTWYAEETERRQYPHRQQYMEALGRACAEGNLCQGKAYHEQTHWWSTRWWVFSPYPGMSHPLDI